MSLAETQELVAELELRDKMSTPAREATAAVAGLEGQVEKTSGRVSALGRVSQGASNSLTHFRGRVSDLAGKAGLVGLGGAALLVGKFLKDSMGEAQAFGDAVDKVATLTGMATERTSKFVDALGYYGIGADRAQSITGMYLKNVDALAASKKKAAEFEQEYGFKLRDSTGHVKDAEEVLTSFIDYFGNKAIPAQERAAAGAKLFGRSWQDLLPVIQEGGKEWRTQLAAGLELSDKQVKAIRESRRAQRDWNDALGDFKVIAGAEVLPVVTELAKSAATWLNDPGNQKTLLGFLRQGIQLGKDLAGFLANTVAPALMGLGQQAQSFWNALPGPLQTLLITGIAADRTVKYLFGFSILGVAEEAVKGIVKGGIGSVLGHFFERGSSPANPLYVTGMGGLGGGAGAGGGVAGGGGRLAGMAGKVLGAVSIVGAALYALEGIQDFMGTVAGAQKDLASKADAESSKGGAQLLQDIHGLTEKLSGLGVLESTIANTWGSAELGRALKNQGAALASLAQQNKLDRSQVTQAIQDVAAAQKEAQGRGWTEVADSLGADLEALKAKLPTAPDIGKAVAEAQPKPAEEQAQSEGQPKTVKVKADPRAARDIGTSVGTTLAPRFGAVTRAITTQGASQLRALGQLRMGQAQALPVEVAQATRLQQLLAAVATLRAALVMGDIREAALLGAIARKPTQLTAITNVSVSTYVATRDVAYRTNIATRYGSQAV